MGDASRSMIISLNIRHQLFRSFE